MIKTKITLRQLLRSLDSLNEHTDALHHLEIYGDGSGFLFYGDTQIRQFVTVDEASRVIAKRLAKLMATKPR